MTGMRSFAFNGSGSGGGSFFGTQTLDNGGQTLLGFGKVAPLLAVLSSLPDNVNVQWVNLSCDRFRVSDFNGKVFSQNKLFYIFNLSPTQTSANAAGGGWSTVTVFRNDDLFEVFALIWTEAFAYQFVAALTPFQLQADGSITAADTPTKLDLYVSGTYPAPPPRSMGSSDAMAALRVGFVCAAQLFAASSPQQRSSALQSYILAGGL
jgi:hypothetical protein